MKNLGGSIIGLADLENRTIKFNAMFVFGFNTAIGGSWHCAVYDGSNNPVPEETAKIRITNSGVFNYDSDVSTSTNYYVKVFCVADYPDNIIRQHIDYWFKFADLLG